MSAKSVKGLLLIAGTAGASAAAARLYNKKSSHKKFAKDEMTFSRLARSLANDFESVFCVDISNDSYTEFGARNGEEQLVVLSRGDDFYKDTVLNTQQTVCDEDRVPFLYALDKDNLIHRIRESGSFTLNYRILRDGLPVHYTLKAIRGSGVDEHFLIIGIRNTDADVKRQEAAHAKEIAYRKLTDALADRFDALYSVDLETDDFTEYTSAKKYSVLSVGSEGKDFFTTAKENIRSEVFPEDAAMMTAVMDKESLVREIRENGSFIIGYRLMLSGRPEYVQMKAVLASDSLLLIGITNVNKAKLRELELRHALGSDPDLAGTDPLTGVKNRRAFKTAEDQLNADIASGKSPAFSAAVFDINDIKKIQDMYGIREGDEAVKTVCSMICNTFKHSPVFRIGNDEFAVILKNDDNDNREALIGELESAFLINKTQNKPVAACGIASFLPVLDSDFASVFERAFAAMRKNKAILKE